MERRWAQLKNNTLLFVVIKGLKFELHLSQKLKNSNSIKTATQHLAYVTLSSNKAYASTVKNHYPNVHILSKIYFLRLHKSGRLARYGLFAVLEFTFHDWSVW